MATSPRMTTTYITVCRRRTRTTTQVSTVPAGTWLILRRAIMAIIHRPLLLATLVIAGILLMSAINESAAAGRIDAQVNATRIQNDAQRATNTDIHEQAIELDTDAQIISRAIKLGYARLPEAPVSAQR
jgi:cell division protein FtsB